MTVRAVNGSMLARRAEDAGGEPVSREVDSPPIRAGGNEGRQRRS